MIKSKLRAFTAALLLAGSAVALSPAYASDPIVGGSPMSPMKNIIENAVNSKDHTTLVAAVKAAGLVETLQGRRPFHSFRSDQRSLRQAAKGHRRDASEAREQRDAGQNPHLPCRCS